MKAENKWTKYEIYKGDKLIDRCTKKQVNEWISMGFDLEWLCRESRKLKRVEG